MKLEIPSFFEKLFKRCSNLFGKISRFFLIYCELIIESSVSSTIFLFSIKITFPSPSNGDAAYNGENKRKMILHPRETIIITSPSLESSNFIRSKFPYTVYRNSSRLRRLVSRKDRTIEQSAIPCREKAGKALREEGKEKERKGKEEDCVICQIGFCIVGNQRKGNEYCVCKFLLLNLFRR